MPLVNLTSGGGVILKEGCSYIQIIPTLADLQISGVKQINLSHRKIFHTTATTTTEIQGLILKRPTRPLNFKPPHLPERTMYSCNICNQDFTNRNVRDTHRKSTCISSLNVRKQNGEKETIEKMNGKFNCICGRSFTRTDHFSSHWRECQTQGKVYF